MNQRPVITWRMKALVFASSSSPAIFGGNYCNKVRVVRGLYCCGKTNQTLSFVVDLESRLCEYVYILRTELNFEYGIRTYILRGCNNMLYDKT